MKRITIIFFIIFLTKLSLLSAEDNEKSNPFSGYYKNLFITSKTTSTDEVFFADINRLRLQFSKNLTKTISIFLAVDNEAIINDFSNTPDFDVIRQENQKNLAFWDADKVSADKKHIYVRHSLYRGYLKYYSSSFQAILGKQAIDWSRMRFYHPFDLFNPISPLDIEKDEKIGVDAVNLEFYPAALSSISFIFAPNKNLGKESFGLRLVKKIHNYDLSFIAAESRKDKILGFGFDGYIKEAGFRGEASFTKKDNKKEFARVVIGFDHNFTPKLYAVAEYFYNGGAEKDVSEFINSFEFSRQALTIRKHILGTGIEYELSGITKLANYLFYDFEGKSIFVNPEFRYNIFTNLDLSAGIQFFSGSNSSEFGSYKNTYYVQAKYFF